MVGFEAVVGLLGGVGVDGWYVDELDDDDEEEEEDVEEFVCGDVLLA